MILTISHKTQENVNHFQYQNLDTLSFYSVSLRYERSGDSQLYWLNDKIVDEKTYEKYKLVWNNIKLCKPCYLMTYDVKDRLLRSADQHGDCVVGEWKSYYKSGKLKTAGNYKKNDTEDWTKLWDRGYCSVKEGNWYYYNRRGKVVKTEQYKNGELIK